MYIHIIIIYNIYMCMIKRDAHPPICTAAQVKPISAGDSSGVWRQADG